jgi:hypothetical protein
LRRNDWNKILGWPGYTVYRDNNLPVDATGVLIPTSWV